MRAPAKPPQREGKGAEEGRNGTGGDRRGGEGREKGGRGRGEHRRERKAEQGGAGEEQRRRAREKKTMEAHTLTLKTTKKVWYCDAPDGSIKGGLDDGPSPWNGSSGGEPGATDASI